MRLTRRRDPSAPPPYTGFSAADTRSPEPVGLGSLPRPVAVVPTGPESSPLPATTSPRRAGAIAARAGMLLLHRQIERDLHEISRQLPTVVLPTGTEVWPAPWDFRHSRRLIDAASATAGRFIDGLRVSGPGMYRAEENQDASAGARGTSSVSLARAGL